MGRLEYDRMFLAVIETGSFTGAAEKLGTSSGQASKLLSRLEGELGVRLLNRPTRSISPTKAGRAYYDRLKPLVDELDALDLDIRNISQSPRGRLRLTAPLTFGTLELAPALNEFSALCPDIELDVFFSDRMVNVVDEGFDLAVRVGRPGDSGLIIRRLCAVRIVVVGAPSYLGTHDTPDAPSDLAQHSCIIDTNFRKTEPVAVQERDRRNRDGERRQPHSLFELRGVPSGRRTGTRARLRPGLCCGGRVALGQAGQTVAVIRNGSLRRARPLSAQPSSRRQGASVRRLSLRAIPADPQWEQGW